MKTNHSQVKIAETTYYGDFAIYQANNNWVATDTILDVSKVFETFSQALDYADSEMHFAELNSKCNG
jgi:hypothetical protein